MYLRLRVVSRVEVDAKPNYTSNSWFAYSLRIARRVYVDECSCFCPNRSLTHPELLQIRQVLEFEPVVTLRRSLGFQTVVASALQLKHFCKRVTHLMLLPIISKPQR